MINNQILSICITVKNRSKVTWSGVPYELQLLPDCIRSIGNLYSKKDRVEIVISDWNSSDWPLHEWMPNICNNPYKIINIDKEGFSKGYGINTAVKHAMGDNIFIMDADIILNSKLIIQTGMRTIMNGGVYFPIPKYIVNMNGHFRYNCGVGNVVISKQMLLELGGIPEYWRYGFEDSDFYKLIEQKGINMVCECTDNLIHPYHPQSLNFKERYIDNNPEHDKEINKRVEIYKNMRDNNEDFKL